MDLPEIQDLVERYRQRGMNPIERLDAQGLILTDARHVQLARQVCELLADRIEQQALKTLMGEYAHRSVISLSDVKQAIVRYIRENFTETQLK